MSDLSITATNVVPSNGAILIFATLGEILSAGKVVYVDALTNTVKAAKADALGTSSPVGILATGGSSGQRAIVVVKDEALAIGATVPEAAVLALSFANAGGIAPITDLVAGEAKVYQRIFGTGKPSNKISVDFNPGRVIAGEIEAEG